MLHHGFAGARPAAEACDCPGEVGRLTDATGLTHGVPCAPPVEHDCDECATCELTENPVAIGGSAPRPVAIAVAAGPLDVAAACDSRPYPSTSQPAPAHLLAPQPLHAILLPLLN